MNEYVDIVCILEDDTNRSKENVPPPHPVPYTKICPILVPNIISYDNTSHLIILFVDVVHAWEYQNFNRTHLKIEALFLLYDTLQLFLNHTDAVYRLGAIHNNFNKFGNFWIPFQNYCLCYYTGINLCLL